MNRAIMIKAYTRALREDNILDYINTIKERVFQFHELNSDIFIISLPMRSQMSIGNKRLSYLIHPMVVNRQYRGLVAISLRFGDLTQKLL